MILKIPPEPTEIRDWMQSLMKNQFNDPAINSDDYIVWAGNKLPKYLWDNWKENLKPLGITWQKFMRILKRRTDVGVMWYQGTLPWADFIQEISELIKSPIGKDAQDPQKKEKVSALSSQDLGACQLPAISDWEKFERLCLDVWSRQWGNTELQRCGRRGQSQAGVDVYGYIHRETDNMGGVQCKRKDAFADGSLTVSELRDIVEEAKKFRPLLKMFIIAFTGKRDKNLQVEALKITEAHQKLGLFQVHVFSWDDIKEVLGNYPDIVEKYYPFMMEVGPKKIEEIKQINDKILRNQTDWGQITNDNIKISTDVVRGDLASMTELIKSSSGDLSLNHEYKSELDDIRNLVESNCHKEALDVVLALEKRLGIKTEAIVKFRILTNKAVCLSALSADNEKEAGTLFIEAYQYNPDDEKALCNRALGYFLIGQEDDAIKFASEILQKNPVNIKANEIFIYGLSNELPLEEIIAKIPRAIRESEEIACAFAYIAKQKGDLSTAVKWLEVAFKNIRKGRKTPDLLAEIAALLLQLLSNRFEVLNGVQLTSEDKKKIQRSLDLLSEAISILENSETLKFRASWFVNRSIAYKFLGNLEKALSDIEKAVKLAPDNASFLKQKAFILYEYDRKRAPEAIKLIGTLVGKEEVPEAALLLAGMLYETGKENEAIPILLDSIEKGAVSADLQREQKSLLIQVYLKKDDWKSARDISNELRASDPTSVLNLVEAARIEKIAGDANAYSSLLNEARSYVTNAVSIRDLFVIAEELYSAQRYAEAWPVYERFVDITSGTRLINKLIYSYYQAEQYEKALEAVRAVPALFKDRFIYEIEVSILDSIDDLDGAVAVSEKYLSEHPNDLAFRIKLAVVYLRKGDNARLDEFLKSNMDLNSLSSDIALDTIRQLAWLYSERNMSQRALEIVYWLRKKHIRNADAHLAYISIFFNREKYFDKQLSSGIVQAGMVVCVQEELGNKNWYIIEDEPELIQDEIDLDPNDSIARKLIGKKINDTIILNEDSISEVKLKVAEIKSKYVYALHKSMENFSYLFASNPSLKRFSVRTNGTPEEVKKDFNKIFDTISSRDEWIIKVQKFYEEGKITIGTFANIINKNVIVVWGGLAGNRRIGIRCCMGNLEERQKAFELLKKHKEVAIDITALLTCGSIERLDILKKTFNKIFVAQSVIDTINEEVSEKNGVGSNGFMTVWKENGQFYRNEVTAEDIKNQVTFLKKIKEWVEKNCERLPVKEALKLSKIRRGQLQKTIGKSFLDTILLAKEKKCLIYSDDKGTRDIAQIEFGISGVWTQVVAISTQAKGNISAEELEKININLLKHNYYYTIVSPLTLVEAAEQAKWTNSEPFITALNNLRQADTEFKSAIFVAINFCYLLWKKPLMDFQREALVFAVLDAVSQKMDKVVFLKIFSSLVPVKFRLVPLAGQHLLKLVTAWRSIRI